MLFPVGRSPSPLLFSLTTSVAGKGRCPLPPNAPPPGCRAFASEGFRFAALPSGREGGVGTPRSPRCVWRERAWGGGSPFAPLPSAPPLLTDPSGAPRSRSGSPSGGTLVRGKPSLGYSGPLGSFRLGRRESGERLRLGSAPWDFSGEGTRRGRGRPPRSPPPRGAGGSVRGDERGGRAPAPGRGGGVPGRRGGPGGSVPGPGGGRE